jgi:formiminotetrahydrofolate cyclodeaminase
VGLQGTWERVKINHRKIKIKMKTKTYKKKTQMLKKKQKNKTKWRLCMLPMLHPLHKHVGGKY